VARSVTCSKICKSNRIPMPGPTLPPLTAAGDAEETQRASAAQAVRSEAKRCEVRLYCSLRLKKLEAETSDIARGLQAQAGAGRARALPVACRPQTFAERNQRSSVRVSSRLHQRGRNAVQPRGDAMVMAMAMAMAMAGSWGATTHRFHAQCPAIACGGDKETKSAVQDRKRSASGWTGPPTDPQQGRTAGQGSRTGRAPRRAARVRSTCCCSHTATAGSHWA
jgi:hypothetical protein